MARTVNDLITNENIMTPDLEIEDLIKAYGREIFSYCYHLLRNKEDAEDAVQEIFLKAYYGLEKKRIASISLWLYKVAYNHCLNILRKRKFKILISLDENMLSCSPTPEEELENSEYSDLYSLPPSPMGQRKPSGKIENKNRCPAQKVHELCLLLYKNNHQSSSCCICFQSQ
jgi:DNA-directed RNA polymerase specialized sigma24 family protein